MPKRGENIRKRKDGRWEGRYINGYDAAGRAKYKSVYAASYAEVKRELLSLLSEQNSCAQGRRPLRGITVTELLEEWLSMIKIGTSASTFVKYKNAADNHIIPTIGQTRVEKLDAKMLNAFIAQKYSAGRLDGRGGLSASTVGTLCFILNTTLRYAAQQGYGNCDGIVLQQPKEEAREIHILNEDERIRLEMLVMKEMDSAKLGVLICLYTGLRIGEICCLKWEDIDLDAGILRIRNSIQRIQDYSEGTHSKTRLLVGAPKSQNSRRDIPIPSFLLHTLREQFCHIPGSYVLTGSPLAPMEPRTYQYRFKGYLKKAQIEDCNFHVLRHTFATRCIHLGFDPKTLSEILGHSSVKITLNRYVHPSFDMKQKQMELLSVNRGHKNGQMVL